MSYLPYPKLWLMGCTALKSDGDKIKLRMLKRGNRADAAKFVQEHKAEILNTLAGGQIIPTQMELKMLFAEEHVNCSGCPYWQDRSILRGLCHLTFYETSVLTSCDQIMDSMNSLA